MEDGPINVVRTFSGLVVWANYKVVYVSNYKRDRKVCKIERPNQSEYFPSLLYSSSAIKPSLNLKVDQKT